MTSTVPSAVSPPPSMLPVDAAAGLVPGNRWDLLRPPQLGDWAPALRVTVVVPHYQQHEALELTLAALARQSYPRSLLNVVVVDDGSDPPLRLPAGHRGLDLVVVHQEDRGFGLARARNTGAAVAHGDVLVFLDADMVAEPRHVEAHARWHHVCSHALTLGFRRHVEFDGITADDVSRAGLGGSLAPLVAGRPSRAPAWLERHFRRTDGLRTSDDDLFRVVTGGNLGLRASTFHAAGGFDASFDQWGSEDTEFGYRSFVTGALLVPEPAAACWHQGDTQGLEPHERASLAQQRAKISQLVAHPGFRRQRPGRTFAVPALVVEVSVGMASHSAVTATLESVLASEHHDLEVVLDIAVDHPDRARIRREWSGDLRVRTAPGAAHRFSPARLSLVAGVLVEPWTLTALLSMLGDGVAPVGRVTLELAGAPPGLPAVRAVSTRAAGRARQAADDVDRLPRLFGAASIDGAAVGVHYDPDIGLQRTGGPTWPARAGRPRSARAGGAARAPAGAAIPVASTLRGAARILTRARHRGRRGPPPG